MEAMEVLHRIVAADRQAREVYDRARQESRDFDVNLDRLRRELADKAMDRAKADVDRARQEAVTQAQQEIDALDEQYRRQLEALTARFQARRDETVETMFQMTVGIV